MSSVVDNIMLALISFREEMETYLNENNWKDEYTLFIAGDPKYSKKMIVETVKDSRTEIKLPIISVEAGHVRNETRELGDESGTDVVTLTILLRASSSGQLNQLGNLIRRKVNDMHFTVYDYRGANKESVGTADLTDAELSDYSDVDNDSVSKNHVAVINTTLELSAQSFV